MKRLPSVVLVLLALAVVLPGLLEVLAPNVFAAPLASLPAGVDALNEMRAVGGTRIGIACVLAYGAWSSTWRRPALVLGVVVFGWTLVGRVLSTVADGVPGPMLKPEIAEAVLVALSLAALRSLPLSKPLT
jgi:hypothetical protein